MAALNADQPLHGLFMETFARHLRRLSKRIAELHREMAAELSRLKAESGQLKRAERMLADVRQTQARAAEARELMEIVEAASARDAASLP